MLRRIKTFWTPLRLLEAAIVLSVIYVTIWSLHPSLLLSSTTLTGGDTGSHLALPAYLRTQGNLFDLTPWYPGWFAGMPTYTYYFVLPDFLATLGGYVINFAVAFKLATVLGSVLMPITAYCMGRLFRAPRPIPAALAIATLPFLFDASFTIDGGNLFSTMAGEYAFSLSLALSLLAIGLFARGVRTGRGYWWAAIALSLTLAAHVLPWFFAIGAAGVLMIFELLQRRGLGDPRDFDVRGDYARPIRFVFGAGLISAGLSAWWLIAFGTSQNLTNSMGYTNDSVSSLHSIFTFLGWYDATGRPGGDRWVIILAAIAFIVAFWVRDRLGMVLLTLCGLSMAAFVLDPQNVIWNERLVPFWYITIHLSAGWLVGYILYRWVNRRQREAHELVARVEGEPDGYSVTLRFRASDFMDAVFGRWVRRPSGAPVTTDAPAVDDDRAENEAVTWDSFDDESPAAPEPPVPVLEEAAGDPQRIYRRTVRATLAVAILGLATTVPGLIPGVAHTLGLATGGNQVNSWAQWNYSGYESKPAWPEYHSIMTTMEKVSKTYGCGRAMWEYNSNENRFGTPEALMLMPYWTNNCIDSMEGLLFESSATTPYHFLDQAELSESPSNPQVGLPYGTLNVVEGVEHLQMLGVKYYVAYSPQVIAQANADQQLKLIAQTRKWPSPGYQWNVYLIKHSPMVEGVQALPNVVSGISTRVGWLNANVTWWDSPPLWSIMATDNGPSTWPRSSSILELKNVPVEKVKVTHIVVHTQSISFHVNKVGVPVLVKISYFPRWHVTGGTGPYRVSPNLMVVVPTSKNVAMAYGSSPAVLWGNVITDLTVVAGFVTLWFTLRKRPFWRK